MTAYTIVELTVRDADAENRYSAAAGPILKAFGGEFIAGGPLTMLFGAQDFASGSIIRFADRDAAMSFHNSAEYQALLDDRANGIDCRFSLLG